MSVLFKMSFVCADSIGAPSNGVVVTDQHTCWGHAEKDLVRVCRTIKGYKHHGPVTVASPAEFRDKLKGDGRVYLEYIREDGKKEASLVHPGAESASMALEGGGV